MGWKALNFTILQTKYHDIIDKKTRLFKYVCSWGVLNIDYPERYVRKNGG